MAFMQLLQADDGAAPATVAARADWDGDSAAVMQPRTPALIAAANRQPAPPDQPSLGESFAHRVACEQRAAYEHRMAQQNHLQLPLLPPVQMDRLAYEQLASLSSLTQQPGLELQSPAQPSLPPAARPWQPPTDLPLAMGLYQRRQLGAPGVPPAAYHHSPYQASLAGRDPALWRTGQTSHSSAAAQPSRPMPYRRLPHRASLSPPFRLQLNGVLPAAQAAAAEAARAARAAAAAMAAATAAAARRPLDPGASRVHQALHALNPAVHTLGDLVAAVGTRGLAEVSWVWDFMSRGRKST